MAVNGVLLGRITTNKSEGRKVPIKFETMELGGGDKTLLFGVMMAQ